MIKKITNKRLSRFISSNLLKISTVKCILLSMLFLSATTICNATSTYAQSVLLSLQMENKPMQQVLQEIENNSEFKFFYNTKQINLSQKVSINVSETDVFAILDQIFANTNIGYKVLD